MEGLEQKASTVRLASFYYVYVIHKSSETFIYKIFMVAIFWENFLTN